MGSQTIVNVVKMVGMQKPSSSRQGKYGHDSLCCNLYRRMLIQFDERLKTNCLFDYIFIATS